MKIEANKVVSISYTLRKDSHEGAQIENVPAEKPLEFIFGSGMMLPAFEENLAGLSEGNDFQFMLDELHAYGPVMEENVVDLPKKTFEVDGKVQDGLLVVDNIITMQDNQGNQFAGRVAKIEEETVKMDFNHPMAGQDLYFTGKVVGVRDASPEELDHGHVHGEGHHHH
jgi:FKBP-type peptidyl-prolyl cis-trans isomerase SlyD